MALPELHQAFVHIFKKFNATRALHGLVLAIAQTASESAKALIANPLNAGEQTVSGPVTVNSLRLLGSGTFDPAVAPTAGDVGRFMLKTYAGANPNELWFGHREADGALVWKQLL